MILKLNNDHKEKWQSYTASLNILENIDCEFDGYGVNKEEAIEELKIKLKQFKNQIDEIYKDLKSFDWNNHILVDCLGKPLNI